MKDKIFEFVKSRGPVLSKDVSKHFKIDSTYSGAFLSELIQDKKLLYSKLKIGTSPVYYTKEQLPKLEVLYEHLNSKDKDAFNKLKEKKLLRDSVLQTITRVSLRNIKDFAIPLNVNIGGKKEIFWKWYLISHEEASGLIKKYFAKKEQPKPEEKPVQHEEKNKDEEISKEKEKLVQIKNLLAKERKELENEKIHLQKKLIEDEEKLREKYGGELKKLKQEHESLLSEQKNKIQELENQLETNSNKDSTEEVDELKNKLSYMEKEKERLEKEMRHLSSKPQKDQDSKKEVQEKLESKDINEEEDDFVISILPFFTDKNIEVIDYNIIKKSSECEFTVRIPSVIGMSEYYCRAKKKKKCNEGDLSTAFVKGQIKKLPVLFISPGEITKKAKDMLEKDFKNNLIYRKLE